MSEKNFHLCGWNIVMHRMHVYSIISVNVVQIYKVFSIDSELNNIHIELKYLRVKSFQ